MVGLTVTVGEVVKVDHRERTIVSGGSAGGGVTTLPDGRVIGFQRPMTISTDVVSKDIIWIRAGDGLEREFTFPGDSFRCRESQKVGLIFDQNTIYTGHNFTSQRTIRYYDEAGIRVAFAPADKRSDGVPTLGVLLGLAGLAGIATAIFDPDYRTPGTYGLSIPPLIVSVLAARWAFKRSKEYDRQRAKAGRDATAFLAYLQSLEAKLIAE